MKSLKGQFLLASGRLLDPNFTRTVILMIQHDENGAFGLVLNRPLETTIKEVCDEVLDLECDNPDVIYQGGPCEGPLMVLHGRPAQGEVEVLPEVYFTTDRQQIESLLGEGDGSIKCFVNYAGWTSGQLEMEMESGAWLIAPADKKTIFACDDDEQWSRITTRLSLGKWINPERIPEDPNVN